MNELPTNCHFCGVMLAGSLTQHKPDCEIRKLVEKHFPREPDRIKKNLMNAAAKHQIDIDISPKKE